MVSKTKLALFSLAALLAAAILHACTISITMSGASIPENLNTFSVQYINNRAPLVNPDLSSTLTEGLKDRIQNESRLSLVNEYGDVDFSGDITSYTTKPMAVQADAVSAQTRLTVSVKIRCRNSKDPKKDWEQSFSAYQDYDSENNLADVEEELVKLIVDELTENIFNKAFADW
ncbi:MAG: LPS assembly lipoprotein LptE [Bacteroidales bacterium]|nr:LPS assembly lipoprotein LptE [Bacteroidales bacterium]MDY4174654.1 LptE family protein [Bacteroidales bacterium]